MKRIPVTIVTGALGSGKTSLLNRLLSRPALANTAVILNEYGQVGLDHELVVKIDGPLRVLESGCICCTVQGELATTLRDLFLSALRREIPPFERLLIETTGLARIPPLRHTLGRDFFLAERYRLDAVITVIDACHLPAQLAHSPEVVEQIVQADVLLASKIDLATVAQRQAAEQAARGLNPLAPIQEGGMEASLDELLQQTAPSALPRFLPVWDDHLSGIWSRALVATEPLPWGAFSRALDQLLAEQGEFLPRIKGLLAVQGLTGQRALHAVHHQRYPVEDQPTAATTSRLIVIGRGAALAEQVEAVLSPWFRRAEATVEAPAC